MYRPLAVKLVGIALIFIFLWAAPAFASGKCEPHISYEAITPYWNNYSDYNNGVLSVEHKAESDCKTCAPVVENVVAGKGVTPEISLPMALQEDKNGDYTFVIKYHVPTGISSFHSDIEYTCAPDNAATSQLNIAFEQDFSVSNEGCPSEPVPGFEDLPVPEDQTYQRRWFTVTITDDGGNPVPGHPLKWSLSNESADFRIIESTGVTDENGQARVLVAPPEYFICIYPYYSTGWTHIEANAGDGVTGYATFAYMRCHGT